MTEPTTTEPAETETVDQAPNQESQEPTGTDPDAGAKKALEAERKARRDAERKLRELTEWKANREAAELRQRVAQDKGLTAEQAALLVGKTAEELEAHADALIAAFAPAPSLSPALDGKPREALRSGTDPTLDVAADPGAVADRILSRGL